MSDNISDVNENITSSVVECEVSGKYFKILPQELKFYKMNKLPLPRKHPDQRHMDRLALRNPRKLWERKCDKCNSLIKPPTRLSVRKKFIARNAIWGGVLRTRAAKLFVISSCYDSRIILCIVRKYYCAICVIIPVSMSPDLMALSSSNCNILSILLSSYRSFAFQRHLSASKSLASKLP